MKLKTIFSKPVDRPIEGVIKADDKSGLFIEVEEYELTNELEKRLEAFLESYNQYTHSNGVWISGFFGSGKSHLLKMLSLLLENKPADGEHPPVRDAFLEKASDNIILTGSLQKATQIPSESILFNIDQKADVITKNQVDALLSVFVKVFDEHCGYYGKQAFIAQFERQLDEDGLLDTFKETFQSIEPDGKKWKWGRERINRVSETVDQAYAKTTGNNLSDVINRYRTDYKLSIEDFANQVNRYISKQEEGFRLNFFVDEAGQYIATSTKLMTNLQTVAESLNTKCKGQAWILVTAQQDMNAVIGDMDGQSDFSKIQDRFNVRMNLTSADVAEVIQKRLLKKTEEGRAALLPVYENQQNNFRTLFDFSSGGQTYKNFRDSDDFVSCYPFIPYQFELFQLAIKNLSSRSAFEGKHSSVGERSMLGVFQAVAIQIADHEIGELATFDLMFGGIRSALKGNIQSAIGLAERQLDNPLAVRLLKVLFLVKYVREFKANLRNLCVLMTSSFDQDLNQLSKDVETALNLLDSQVYIQRTGDTYEFLTDDEKDVEQEIKNTEIDTNDVAGELNKIIYDQILKARKLRYDANKQDFNFSRKLDDRTYGREYELGVHVISPFHEHSDNPDQLKMAYIGNPELIVVMPADDRLIRDLTLYKQTSKYVGQNISVTQKEAVKRILTSKQLSNQERHAELVDSIKTALGKSQMFVAGSEIESGSEDPNSRFHDGFSRLIVNTYPNLEMIKVQYTEASIEPCLNPAEGELFDTMGEAEANVLSFINRNTQKSIRTSIKVLVEHFEKKPFGWSLVAIQCTLAKLIGRGKIEARKHSDVLDDAKLLGAIKNTSEHDKVLLEPQIEFTASQVRRLKEFFEQFFDGPPQHSDAKAIGSETAQRFRACSNELALLFAQSTTYPFLDALSDTVERLKRLAEKPYKFFLTEFESQADDLLDIKEEQIEPIRRFMNGPQAKLFKEAKQYIDENEANFNYVEGVEADSIKQILSGTQVFAGNAMRSVKTMLDDLRNQVAEQLKQERQQAEQKVRHSFKRIESLDGYELLAERTRQQFTQEIDQTIHYAKSARLIAVVRESANRFHKGTFSELLERAEREIRKATEPDDPVPKPNVSVSLSENLPYYLKPWLETDAEVDAYIAILGENLKEIIQQGKRIQI